MPEPVVIIGPANRPARPIGEPAPSTAAAAAPDTGKKPNERSARTAMVLRALTRLAAEIFGLLARAFRAIGSLGVGLVRRYPRHSLAAGASILILGAIWYTEFGQRGPVANQIPGSSTASAPKETTKPAETAPTADRAVHPAAIAGKASGDPAPLEPDANVTTQISSPAVQEKSAPAPTLVANDVSAPTVPSRPDASPTDLIPPPTSEPTPTPASSPDQAAPTLLASALPETAPASPPAVGDDGKTSNPANKSVPAIEAPALFGAMTPAPALPPDVVPAPPAGGEPVQLATKLDEPNKTTSTPAPTTAATGKGPAEESTAAPPTQPATPVNVGGASTDTKPNDDPKAPEPHSRQNPADNAKSATVAQPAPTLDQPEPSKNEVAKPELPAQKPAKVDEPSPVAVGAADEQKAAPPVVPSQDPPSNVTKAADTAKPAAESSPGPLELPVTAAAPSTQNTAAAPVPAAQPPPAAASLLDSHASIPDSRSQTTESKPSPPEKKEPEPGNQVPPAAPQTAGAESPGSSATPDDATTKSRAAQNLVGEGWVSVPNSGKVVIDDGLDLDATPGNASLEDGAMPATRDLRAHTARNREFEPESTRAALAPEPEQAGRRSAIGDGSPRNSRSSSATERVEPTSHVVQPNENFWTISRLYYSTGRYYRALWKANTTVCPKIDRLKVNDVIVIPAVEDLNPDYIDPPRTTVPISLGTARRSRTGAYDINDRNPQGLDESPSSSSDAGGGAPVSTTRTNRINESGVPLRRSSRNDPDLDLPAPNSMSDRASDPDRTGRLVHRPLGDEENDADIDAPQTRTAARPRANSAGSRLRPVYKIRPYDTLRSVARDMLGDSHRASEILQLNRDVIDDPAHLTVGQVLELPDDARTSVRRTARR